MTLRLLALALLVLLAGPALAQWPTLSLHLTPSLDANHLPDVEAWQQRHAQAYQQQGIDAQVTDDFPAHLGLSGSLMASFRFADVGLTAGFGSTGGRIHYRDYSGQLFTDTRARRTYWGVVARRELLSGPVVPYAGLTAQFNAVEVDVEQGLELVERTSSFQSAERYSARHVSLAPGLGANLRVIQQVAFHADLAYEVSFGRELRSGDGMPLAERNMNPASSTWNGLRLSAGLRARF